MPYSVDLTGSIVITVLHLIGLTKGVSLDVLVGAIVFTAVMWAKVRDWMENEDRLRALQERINNL